MTQTAKGRGRKDARSKKAPGPCEECQINKGIYVHHRDGDPGNNTPSNLMRICRRCHGQHHSLVMKPTKVPPELIRVVVNACRRSRCLEYDALSRLFKVVRKTFGIQRPSRWNRRLPMILPDASLRKFYETIDRADNLQHQIMLRLLLYTGIRVSELCNIQVEHVDLGGSKIFIQSGKGNKDRYILFPESFRLTLKTHLAANPDNRYLFESRQRDRFTVRRIEQIVADYAEEAGIPERVHPHLLRHQLLTWLTSQGMPDAQIQLISGHATKKSLEVYQHLSLKDAKESYQAAVKGLEI